MLLSLRRRWTYDGSGLFDKVFCQSTTRIATVASSLRRTFRSLSSCNTPSGSMGA